MGQSMDGVVRIRRPWSEELVWTAATLVIALVVVFWWGKHNLLVFYAFYLPAYLAYNRRMGVDLRSDSAVIRRPYRRARTLRRDEISDVVVDRVGNSRIVAFRDAEGRPVKLTVMNSVGPWGRERVDRTHRQIWRWWNDRPASVVPEPNQMPGSASI